MQCITWNGILKLQYWNPTNAKSQVKWTTKTKAKWNQNQKPKAISHVKPSEAKWSQSQKPKAKSQVGTQMGDSSSKMHAKHVPFLRLSKFLTLTEHHQSFLDFKQEMSQSIPLLSQPFSKSTGWSSPCSTLTLTTCAEAAPKQLGPRHMVWPVRPMHLLGLGWASPTKIIEFHGFFFTKPGWFNRNIVVVTLSSGLSTHDGPRYSIPPSVHLLFSDGKERVHTHLARIFGTLSGQSNPKTYGLRFEISYQPTIGFGTMYPLYPFVRLT